MSAIELDGAVTLKTYASRMATELWSTMSR
ncbi:hypothetical protein EMGBS4_01760 [Acidimicrobiaceae bacterium]|nr:hypothetical protein EMGBS4_01760 [Acidimicrobiaceae bacterium]